MLQIFIPGIEIFDQKNGEFIKTKDQTLQLEHSLVSLSKWESKWHIPFLSDKAKTYEQNIDYIRCMTITQNVDPNIYRAITPDLIEKINNYIEDPMTATTFGKSGPQQNNKKQIITAEIIYYWMVSLQIPFECQKWHLNRLLTLIRVVNIKNSPQKKMSKGEIRARNRSLNAARRARTGSRG